MKLKLKLIDNWKKFYKMWSVWVFIIISIAPELHNGLASMGWLEQSNQTFLWVVRILAGVGIFSRLIKQKTLEDKNVFN